MASVSDAEAEEIENAAIANGMDVLVEVHQEDELERALNLKSRLIGINNRDLRTFKTSLDVSERLAPLVPHDRIVVGESGINGPADLARLSRIGISTFLIGESLMRQADVTNATRTLLARDARSTAAE
jgi:indole-3-glycerol phosphate synthase